MVCLRQLSLAQRLCKVCVRTANASAHKKALRCIMPIDVAFDITVTNDCGNGEVRRWRVSPDETRVVYHKGREVRLLRIGKRGSIALCFPRGEVPDRCVSLSEGLHQLVHARNQAAFDCLAAQADMLMNEPAPKKKAKRMEINTKRQMGNDEVIDVDVPTVTLLSGTVVGNRTIAMLRPIQQADALWVEADGNALSYCFDVIGGMQMIDKENRDPDMPKGCCHDATRPRIICRFFDEVANRVRYKAFKVASDTAAGCDGAKRLAQEFIDNGYKLLNVEDTNNDEGID